MENKDQTGRHKTYIINYIKSRSLGGECISSMSFNTYVDSCVLIAISIHPKTFLLFLYSHPLPHIIPGNY